MGLRALEAGQDRISYRHLERSLPQAESTSGKPGSNEEILVQDATLDGVSAIPCLGEFLPRAEGGTPALPTGLA